MKPCHQKGRGLYRDDGFCIEVDEFPFCDVETTHASKMPQLCLIYLPDNTCHALYSWKHDTALPPAFVTCITPMRQEIPDPHSNLRNPNYWHLGLPTKPRNRNPIEHFVIR